MPWPRQTHTVAELSLTPAAYDEIAAALRQAGYDHAFLEDGLIDMSGIGVTRSDDAPAGEDLRATVDASAPQ